MRQWQSRHVTLCAHSSPTGYKLTMTFLNNDLNIASAIANRLKPRLRHLVQAYCMPVKDLRWVRIGIQVSYLSWTARKIFLCVSSLLNGRIYHVWVTCWWNLMVCSATVQFMVQCAGTVPLLIWQCKGHWTAFEAVSLHEQYFLVLQRCYRNDRTSTACSSALLPLKVPSLAEEHSFFTGAIANTNLHVMDLLGSLHITAHCDSYMACFILCLTLAAILQDCREILLSRLFLPSVTVLLVAFAAVCSTYKCGFLYFFRT